MVYLHFIFCDGTMGFGPALLGCFVSASSSYSSIYLISSIITLIALPICLHALKGKNNDLVNTS